MTLNLEGHCIRIIKYFTVIIEIQLKLNVQKITKNHVQLSSINAFPLKNSFGYEKKNFYWLREGKNEKVILRNGQEKFINLLQSMIFQSSIFFSFKIELNHDLNFDSFDSFPKNETFLQCFQIFSPLHDTFIYS